MASPFKDLSPRPAAAPQPLLDIIVICSPIENLRPQVETWGWLCKLSRSEPFLDPQGNSPRLVLYNTDQDATQVNLDVVTEPGLYSAASCLLADILLHLRVTEEQRQRPLVFIAHSVGGLVVKQALMIASQHKSVDAEIHSIYLSTCLVVFGATPHYGIPGTALQMCDLSASVLLRSAPSNEDQVGHPLWRLHECFRAVIGHIEVCHLWEQQPTTKGTKRIFIVEKDSAAPHDDRLYAAVSPVDAPHMTVLKLDDQASRGFLTVLNALKSCLQRAPAYASLRWRAGTEHREPLTSQRSHGHEYSANNISGGRAHLGDNITNVYMSPGTNWFKSLGLSPWSAPLRPGLGTQRATNLTRKCSPHFTGRKDELRELTDYFGSPRSDSNESNLSRIAVIHAMGGQGKTELCLKLAETVREHYWGLFWIDASSRQTAEDAFCILGQAYGAGGSFAASKSWLSECPYPWLLFLDNADDTETNYAELVPDSKYGHVVITTRRTSLEDDFSNPHTLGLGGMVPKEAIEFLLLASGRRRTRTQQQNAVDPLTEEERESAASVAKEVRYLALALKLAGTAISKAFKTIGDYLLAYKKAKDGPDGGDFIKSNPLLREEARAIASWSVSFKKIGHDSGVVFDDAMSLLAVMVNLHFEMVPERLFRMAWLARKDREAMTVNFLDMDSIDWSSWEMRLRGALIALDDYSIVDYDTENQRCAMHPVIHRWARFEMEKRNTWQSSQKIAVELLARCISSLSEPSTRAFRRSLLPHFDTWWKELLKTNIHGTSTYQSARARQQERFASLYAETGNWQRALKLQQRVVEHHERTKGASHFQTLSARRTKSQMQWDSFAIGDAITTRAEILAIRIFSRPRWSDWRPVWPPRYLEYCIALDDLTQSLWLAGELGVSEHIGRIARTWFVKHRGTADPLTLTASLNLARTLSHLGRLAEARQLLEDSLKDRQRFFGMNHVDTLTAQNELGMVDLACGRFEDARTKVLEVYQRRQDVLGEDHAYTLWSANDLAKVYFSIQNEREVYPRAHEAVDLLASIIPVVKRTLGNDHGGMVMTKGNLARAYVRSGRPDLAMEILRDVFCTVKEDHPSWAEIMTGQAEVQLILGQFANALESCQKVLDQERPASGPRVPWILRSICPVNPVRSSDLQRAKVLQLKERIELAMSTSSSMPGSPESFASAFTTQGQQ